MEIKPQRDLLLIEIKKQNESASGLVITNPDIILEQAEVLEIGPEVKNIHTGDTVLFKAWATDIVTIGDKEYVFLEEKGVLSTVE
ncbi:MAG: hypothetical protein OEV44_01150 [Spirochaetota bacterium]|nr:hypothetical protein [Spirochaetota bacterium]